jgi:hypothetical protein
LVEPQPGQFWAVTIGAATLVCRVDRSPLHGHVFHPVHDGSSNPIAVTAAAITATERLWPRQPEEAHD